MDTYPKIFGGWLGWTSHTSEHRIWCQCLWYNGLLPSALLNNRSLGGTVCYPGQRVDNKSPLTFPDCWTEWGRRLYRLWCWSNCRKSEKCSLELRLRADSSLTQALFLNGETVCVHVPTFQQASRAPRKRVFSVLLVTEAPGVPCGQQNAGNGKWRIASHRLLRENSLE